MEDKDRYTALHLKRRKNPRKKDPSPTDWKSVAVALGGVAVFQLGIVIGLTSVMFKGYFWTPLSSSATCLNPQTFMNSGFVFEDIQLTSEELKDHVCEDSKGSLCEICPYSWTLSGGRCYFFSEEFKSWNSSQEYCASRFSDLITIDDQNEMDLVAMVAKNSLYTWIGLRYSDVTMDWRWMNGSRLQTGSLTMKDQARGGSCGAFRSKEIQPDDCITKNRWICEKKVIRTSS